MGCVVRIAIVLAVVGCATDPSPPPIVPVVLSAPGPLVMGHSELDQAGACNRCHVDNSSAVDANKCLSCHGPIAQRIATSKGLHASAVVRGKPCEACHMDHRGRGYDPMGWKSMRGGSAGFDHDLTGWPLEGRHRTTACENCHATRDAQGLATFLGTDKLCGSCHAAPHGFTLRAFQACDRCHSAQAWQPPLLRPRFDHDDRRDARMPLVGAHAGVACRACHAAAKFGLALAVPDRCDNCHQSPHAGQLFNKASCAWCHSPTLKTFAAVSFDHNEKTRFDLDGHKALPCERCHPASLGVAKPAKACEMCHAARSPHEKRFALFGSPPACAKCHTARFGAMPPPQWRPTGFDHSRNTKFPLRGKHAELTCRACHRGSGPTNFEKLDASKGCMGCHEHTNVHDKKYTNDQCTKCHIAPG